MTLPRLILVFLLLASWAAGQTTRPSRIIALLPIGGEWGDKDNRFIPAEIVKDGWGVYLKRHLDPLIKAGVSRAALWTLYGRDAGLGMDFAGLDEVRKLGLRSRTHYGLPTALKRYAGACQVICYIGMPPSDGQWADRELHAGTPNAGRYFRFCDLQTQQIRDGRADVGLDVTSGISVNSMAWAWITYRRLSGETIIGEGWPEAKSTHLYDLPFFVTEGNLAQAQAGGFAAAKRAVLTGEIIVILQGPDGGESWESDWEIRKAKKYLADGFSVCVPMSRQIGKGRLLADFGG